MSLVISHQFFAPQNKNENSAPPRHQGVDSPKPHCGLACFSCNFGLFINIYGHVDMVNKVSFGMRRTQLSTHFLFRGRVGKIHHFSQLPLCVVPKSCTHHLTHNNNNLLSRKEKKGENQWNNNVCAGCPCWRRTESHTSVPARWMVADDHLFTHSFGVNTHSHRHRHTCPLCPGTVSVFLLMLSFVFARQGSAVALESDVVQSGRAKAGAAIVSL